MRLTQLEVQGIVLAITPFVEEHQSELRLFGSRVDDHLKGGDIDLLLLLDQKRHVSNLFANKHYILAKIKEKIGDQKIDLKIALQKDIENDPFLQLVFPQSILIHQW